MTKSAEAGRWTNFGPVESELAQLVYDRIGRPAGKAVVMASSATSALHALAGSHAERAGRPLVWAVSAFGFFSTRIGPLANHIRILDCDRSGLMDLAALKALPPDQWEGLIVTDIFGMQPDFTPFSALCQAAGKPMIIDSAVSFPAQRPASFNAGEIISFHHTKPWGFGEGGCMLIDRTQEETARALLNFGVHLDRSLAPYAANGKMSDVAAALIHQRVETMPRWAEGYRKQRRRMTELARAEKLSILVTPPDDSVTPHVQVLSPRPLALADLPKLPFSVAKYYPPLGGPCPVAADLYARIVAVPCHPGMADIEDDVLRGFFRQLAADA
ncbi:MAG: DegT/DnrJ/EryC1/StrS aminotransferase family protein [Bradyrhizobiaceae bacterium]|nr:MAG: DegT/DnrJ/EryC1/StrS aminotransferase family protein [Bradyrhizobiaceae bacterium]